MKHYLVCPTKNPANARFIFTPVSRKVVTQWQLWDARARALAYELPFVALVFASPETRLVDPRLLSEADESTLQGRVSTGAGLATLNETEVHRAAQTRRDALLSFSGTSFNWHFGSSREPTESVALASDLLATWQRALSKP